MAETPVDFLALHARETPAKSALIDDRPDGKRRQRSFAELNAHVNRLAHALRAAGVEPHDRVAWCGQNSIDAIALTHAARKLRVTPVAVNYRFTDDEAAFVAADSDARLLWVDSEYADRFARIRPRLPAVGPVVVFDGPPGSGQIAAEAFLKGQPDTEPEVSSELEPAATMHYTSGTTGRPKGAVRRTTGRPGQARELPNMLDLIGYGPGDVYITTGPLYHSGPGEFATISTMLGNTIVVQRRFDAEDWLRLVDAYRVTSVYAAPTPIRRVCALPDEVRARYDVSSVRITLAGAAPWSYALKLRYLECFPEDSLWEVYGSTELGVNTLLAPPDQRRKPGSCGRPVPGVEIELFGEDGQPVREPGVPGELFVRSPLLFDAYHKNAEQFEASRRRDFHSVGDVAYFDTEGYYYICDRKADMIISGGVNIYPAEVESALEMHPDVFEAAVIGVPSEEWGESVHALIVPLPGRTPSTDDLTAHARERLAGFKIPRSFELREDLPHNGAGKLLKRELREPYWQGRGNRLV